MSNIFKTIFNGFRANLGHSMAFNHIEVEKSLFRKECVKRMKREQNQTQ